jgi:S1-C subfamily serine protease
MRRGTLRTAGLVLAALATVALPACDAQVTPSEVIGSARSQANLSTGASGTPAAAGQASPAAGTPAAAGQATGVARTPTVGGQASPAAGTAAARGQASPAATTATTGTTTQAVAITGIDVAQVAAAARPSVVNIITKAVALDQLRQRVEVPSGVGTGTIFDNRGYILTNSHVIRSGGNAPAERITVSLADERTFDARVIDDDPMNDLAIIKIDAPNLTVAKLGDSDRLTIGEPVVAMGFALALPGGPTVTTGVVSAVGRQVDEPNGVMLPSLVQTDAAINPGNSGGPLLNARAEVIGVNTLGAADAQGIAFAVSINQAKPAMESVVATGRVVWPYLGANILGSITPAIARANNLPVDRGVVIRPDPSGPAAAAGLRDGDIVVGADGQDVRAAPDLLAAIRRHKPGEQLRLRVVRAAGGAPVEIPVTLGQRVGSSG